MSTKVFKAPFVRSAYNYDVEEASDAAAMFPVGESLTVQSMTEDSDINVMMKRFGITGKMPENPRIPNYGDFSGVTDYQSALNAVVEAQDEFMLIPADLRARWENNPQKYLEFCSKEENRGELEKLGFLKPPKVEPAPTKVEVVNPAPPTTPPKVA